MKIDPKYAKLVAAAVAVVLGVAGVYFPEYQDVLNTIVGLVVGKEYLLGSGHVEVQP